MFVKLAARGPELADIYGTYASQLRWVAIPECAIVESKYCSFADSQSLHTLAAFDGSAMGNASALFAGCVSLRALPSIDFSNVYETGAMLAGCYSLQSSGIHGITVTHSYNETDLGVDAMVEVFGNLGVASGGASITTPNALDAELTEQQIAIAEAKGWSVYTGIW